MLLDAEELSRSGSAFLGGEQRSGKEIELRRWRTSRRLLRAKESRGDSTSERGNSKGIPDNPEGGRAVPEDKRDIFLRCIPCAGSSFFVLVVCLFVSPSLLSDNEDKSSQAASALRCLGDDRECGDLAELLFEARGRDFADLLPADGGRCVGGRPVGWLDPSLDPSITACEEAFCCALDICVVSVSLPVVL